MSGSVEVLVADAAGREDASVPVDAARDDASRLSGPETAEYSFSRRIVCLSDPGGAAAERYRALQTRLLASHVRDGRRGLALCSAIPGTGCTTVAVNLAIACAQAGINTLLVDANLQRAAIDSFIQPVPAASGLAQMLIANSEQQTDNIHREVRPSLSVLFAGHSIPQTFEPLATRRFKKIIDECMRGFDLTIVDTPALLGNSEARHIAMAVRYALVVARRDVTRLADVKAMIADLSTDRVQLVGSALTAF